MDLFDVARSCARRWYFFLPLLLIVGWFSYDSYSSVKPVYYANAVIGLTPPSTKVYNPPSGVPTPRNGLLDIGGADLIANMAAGGLREPSAVDRVVADGGLPDYGSRMFPVAANTSPLPMIMIEETAADPAAVTRTLELVIAQADVTLRALQQQAQVPVTEMMTPFVVNSPSTPRATMPSRTRSTVAIFVAGAGLVVLLTVIVDTLIIRLIRRRAKRGRRAERVRGLLVEDVGEEPEAPEAPAEVEESAGPAEGLGAVEHVAEAEAVATEVETEDAVPANANEPNDATTAPEGALEAR